MPLRKFEITNLYTKKDHVFISVYLTYYENKYKLHMQPSEIGDLFTSTDPMLGSYCVLQTASRFSQKTFEAIAKHYKEYEEYEPMLKDVLERSKLELSPFQLETGEMRNKEAYNALIKKANELKIVQAYNNDIVTHDKRILSSEYDEGEDFYWYIYDCGTHMNKNQYNITYQLDKGNFIGGKLFHWTGKELVEINYERKLISK